MKVLGASGGLILLSIALGSLGQVLLKVGASRLVLPSPAGWVRLLPEAAGQMLQNPPIITGMLLFVISSFLWILGVSQVELSVAYPMVSLGYGIVLLVSWLFLGEAVSWVRVVGVAVIIAGVVLVARS
ncbi:SMR family transporter [Heliophilum fasciatum]|uniref:EamA-like transporter family protein n=1 Tax=Heliophilum fasciatum TaxID=35700 RepID=A0A4V6NRR7_9FIRM|nr:SMR family transporter [Heliophilum fasciatum]MCW2277430.1 multidrug transporter EmrE-like cation transporter [Heliophilum fasciatum]TCP67266.1 EamA-like transporter family protein [Heliophilum fasciatum]